MRACEIPIEELALAYELHVDGVPWKYIAKGLNVDYEALRYAVKNLMRDGLRDQRQVIVDWALHGARSMRRDGIGWNSIAEHLGVNPIQLRNRYYKSNRRFQCAA